MVKQLYLEDKYSYFIKKTDMQNCTYSKRNLMREITITIRTTDSECADEYTS